MHISVDNPLLAATFVIVVFLVFVLAIIHLRPRPRRKRGHSSARGQAPARKRTSINKKDIPKVNGRIPSWQKDPGARVANQYDRARSPEWPRVAHEHLSHEPACVVCGHRGKGLQVHHIKPFHLYPELELDPNNLITLCEIRGRTHHLLIGHLDDWESYNKRVREDTKRYSHQSATAIKANPTWQKEAAQRPMS
ncbi:HNH endonuclease [Ktedonobacter racemifer]|uniref:HNH endonuclease n=1 Tax=Ktedonobacter racemifer DSM 44963 TaxID=485913 RepID=D6TQV4_KTERA|nr:HNH endonuclease [Ktedonobacter racemifer]EFH85825.1 HNH endonuclease [Ktedonobacter racemifer DSM 44963]